MVENFAFPTRITTAFSGYSYWNILSNIILKKTPFSKYICITERQPETVMPQLHYASRHGYFRELLKTMKRTANVLLPGDIVNAVSVSSFKSVGWDDVIPSHSFTQKSSWQTQGTFLSDRTIRGVAKKFWASCYCQIYTSVKRIFLVYSRGVLEMWHHCNLSRHTALNRNVLQC